MDKDINYKASLTAQQFHSSNKIVRGFLGPVGNGKSVACINELHRLAVLQRPNCDGIRKTRAIIVRNTYDMLQTTTLATFKQWLPEEICRYTAKPMRAYIGYPLRDKTIVECEVIFMSLDGPEDVKKLLSLETSFIFINEAKELPYAVVDGARERIGRYPSKIDGYADVYDDDGVLVYEGQKELDEDGNILYQDGEIVYRACTRKALIMDTNPPDDTHWWYQLAEEGKLKDDDSARAVQDTRNIFEFFRGVPPLIKDGSRYLPNPKAENIAHLPGGYNYYLDMIAGKSKQHINVMVMGNYGSLITGKPCYPEYNDAIHCSAEELGVIPSIPVCIGMDFGLNPSFVFGQLTSLGQLRIFAELTTDDNNIRQFARDVVKPFINRNLKDCTFGFAWGDPAGNIRGEGEGKTALGILNDNYLDYDGDITVPLDLPFYSDPAKPANNDITRRLDAVKTFLTRLTGDGKPGYFLSKGCTVLRKAKLGGYCLAVVKSSHGKFKEKPDKGQYSHISDAEQYLCLGYLDGAHKEVKQQKIIRKKADRW